LLSHILLYIQSEIAEFSSNNSCTLCHILLYSQPNIPLRLVTYCCTVSHYLLYNQSHITAVTVTKFCTLSHKLLHNQSHCCNGSKILRYVIPTLLKQLHISSLLRIPLQHHFVYRHRVLLWWFYCNTIVPSLISIKTA